MLGLSHVLSCIIMIIKCQLQIGHAVCVGHVVLCLFHTGQVASGCDVYFSIQFAPVLHLASLGSSTLAAARSCCVCPTQARSLPGAICIFTRIWLQFSSLLPWWPCCATCCRSYECRTQAKSSPKCTLYFSTCWAPVFCFVALAALLCYLLEIL